MQSEKMIKRQEEKKLKQDHTKALIEVNKFKNDLKNIGGVSKGVIVEVKECSNILTSCINENLKGSGVGISNVNETVNNFIDMNNEMMKEVQKGTLEESEYFKGLRELKDDLLESKKNIRKKNLGYKG